MINSSQSVDIFKQAINDYHAAGTLQPWICNPYPDGALERILYEKAWVDSVQWHLEDEIRSPAITAERGWSLKKEIDRHNQWRTDTVEKIDTRIHGELKDVARRQEAVMNSETPGWMLDRLSILALKVYHMKVEAQRSRAGSGHLKDCGEKLEILSEQEKDLCTAFDALMDDLKDGRKYMKVYYQMKMYNDKSTNPAIYRDKNGIES